MTGRGGFPASTNAGCFLLYLPTSLRDEALSSFHAPFVGVAHPGFRGVHPDCQEPAFSNKEQGRSRSSWMVTRVLSGRHIKEGQAREASKPPNPHQPLKVCSQASRDLSTMSCYSKYVVATSLEVHHLILTDHEQSEIAVLLSSTPRSDLILSDLDARRNDLRSGAGFFKFKFKLLKNLGDGGVFAVTHGVRKGNWAFSGRAG
ncbi:hypothetical protein BV25DRAFT_1842716 [Artomyces pyxidatus]|uniref:Uncharacterized protein n=1 Tax=Artomyces pyxidatus TaxID=48021 RepID=A0ACB8SHS2_9AGAM|nr:hypothetical protein BV25DRAFT_1842716 [Artomyces pyxidatus]